MTSKIINMADRERSAADRRLEALFESAPIADDGFTDRVLRRVRRRIWVRRLVLPVAAAIGGALAYEPAMALLRFISRLEVGIPQELRTMPASLLSSATIAALSVVLLLAVALALRMLDEF